MSTSSLGAPPPPRAARVTVPQLRAMKSRGERITMVTAYDATFARMLDEAGADVLLVGDSLGMVVQGLDDHPARHGRRDRLSHARRRPRRPARAHRRRHAVHELPGHARGGAAQRRPPRSAEGGAHAVKLEGGRDVAPAIARIVAAGIPVMGHVGLTPQSVHAMGGFRVQGATTRRRSAHPRRREGGRRRRRVRGRARGDPDRPRRRTSPPRSTSRRSGSAPARSATARCWSATTCSGLTPISGRSSSSATTRCSSEASPRRVDVLRRGAQRRVPDRGALVRAHVARRAGRVPHLKAVGGSGGEVRAQRRMNVAHAPAELRAACDGGARARRPSSGSSRRWARCTTGTRARRRGCASAARLLAS